MLPPLTIYSGKTDLPSSYIFCAQIHCHQQQKITLTDGRGAACCILGGKGSRDYPTVCINRKLDAILNRLYKAHTNFSQFKQFVQMESKIVHDRHSRAATRTHIYLCIVYARAAR